MWVYDTGCVEIRLRNHAPIERLKTRRLRASIVPFGLMRMDDTTKKHACLILTQPWIYEWAITDGGGLAAGTRSCLRTTPAWLRSSRRPRWRCCVLLHRKRGLTRERGTCVRGVWRIIEVGCCSSTRDDDGLACLSRGRR